MRKGAVAEQQLRIHQSLPRQARDYQLLRKVKPYPRPVK